MLRYIVKRILLMPVMLIAITFIIFTLVNLVKVNPALIILGSEASMEDVAALNEEMGFDDPIVVRYGDYVVHAVQGDLGTSYYTKKPVMEEVMSRFPHTLKLTLLSIGVAILIGLPLGILCAVKQYSIADNLLSAGAMFIGAMPAFWLSLLLLLTFSLKLGWFPANGISGWRSWILPVVTLSMPYIGVFLRYSRSSMLDTIRQDYVVTARSKGNSEPVVIFKHALRNALMPLVTITGLFIGSLMSSAVVVESVFAIPGLGLLVLNAIKQKDVPLVMGCILVLAIMFLLITLVMDILYAVIDPRIKSSYTRTSRKRIVKKGMA